jgi:hypothetical protein
MCKCLLVTCLLKFLFNKSVLRVYQNANRSDGGSMAVRSDSFVLLVGSVFKSPQVFVLFRRLLTLVNGIDIMVPTTVYNRGFNPRPALVFVRPEYLFCNIATL